MYFHLADLEPKQRYKLIAGAVVPRPIALVTTVNEDGSCNAAPFSAFNYMSEDPPLLALGLQIQPDGHPRQGAPKDTARNIARTGEFVVNTIDEALAPDMVKCAADADPGESEVELLGLRTLPGTNIDVPHLAAAPFSFECRRKVTLDFGSFRSIVIGEIVGIHAREGLVDAETFRIDLAQMNAVGRLTGPYYCTTREKLHLPIPSVQELKRLPT